MRQSLGRESGLTSLGPPRDDPLETNDGLEAQQGRPRENDARDHPGQAEPPSPHHRSVSPQLPDAAITQRCAHSVSSSKGGIIADIQSGYTSYGHHRGLSEKDAGMELCVHLGRGGVC
jgi:hypothetical protein